MAVKRTAPKVKLKPKLDPALKGYLDAGKSDSRLIGNVDRMLQTREPEDRRLDVLHPSEISGAEWCHLASWHLLRGDRVEPERPPLRLRSIFDEGHAIHAKWQGYVREGGWLYGVYACKRCGARAWALSPTVCGLCGHNDVIYKEVPLVDDALRIAGHGDGWVKGLGDDFFIEIKSIGPGTIRKEIPALFEGGGDINTAWRNIKRPFTPHLRQGKLYLELGHRMVANGLLSSFPDEVVFLYELKQDQDFKEFQVYRDPEAVEYIFEAAQIVVDQVRADIPPPCNIDREKGCKKCRPFAK